MSAVPRAGWHRDTAAPARGLVIRAVSRRFGPAVGGGGLALPPVPPPVLPPPVFPPPVLPLSRPSVVFVVDVGVREVGGGADGEVDGGGDVDGADTCRRYFTRRRA